MDDGWHIFDFLFERWISRCRVFPDLVGIRGEIDVGFFFAVEDARLLVVKIANSAFVFVLKKGFVGSNDLGILIEACSNKSDETFNAIRR